MNIQTIQAVGTDASLQPFNFFVPTLADTVSLMMSNQITEIQTLTITITLTDGNSYVIWQIV